MFIDYKIETSNFLYPSDGVHWIQQRQSFWVSTLASRTILHPAHLRIPGLLIQWRSTKQRQNIHSNILLLGRSFGMNPSGMSTSSTNASIPLQHHLQIFFQLQMRLRFNQLQLIRMLDPMIVVNVQLVERLQRNSVLNQENKLPMSRQESRQSQHSQPQRLDAQKHAKSPIEPQATWWQASLKAKTLRLLDPKKKIVLMRSQREYYKVWKRKWLSNIHSSIVVSISSSQQIRYIS